jgi:hypothetical protein
LPRSVQAFLSTERRRQHQSNQHLILRVRPIDNTRQHKPLIVHKTLHQTPRIPLNRPTRRNIPPITNQPLLPAPGNSLGSTEKLSPSPPSCQTFKFSLEPSGRRRMYAKGCAVVQKRSHLMLTASMRRRSRSRQDAGMEVSEDDVRGEELETERLRHYRLINKGEITILTFVLWRKTGRWEKKNVSQW